MTALLISGTAAFFSVTGISMLFSGSQLSVAIMALSLEIGKLVTASFKYRYCKDLKDLLGSILVKQLENFDLKDYYLVPVPMHKSNFRERGFNQSLLLAEYLKDFRLLDCLEKIELTQNQSKLNKMALRRPCSSIG